MQDELTNVYKKIFMSSRLKDYDAVEREACLAAAEMGHNPGNLKGWNGPYLANELPTDLWQRDYVYVYPGNYMEYDIYSFGPDGLEGTEDDVCNWKK